MDFVCGGFVGCFFCFFKGCLFLFYFLFATGFVFVLFWVCFGLLLLLFVVFLFLGRGGSGVEVIFILVWEFLCCRFILFLIFVSGSNLFSYKDSEWRHVLGECLLFYIFFLYCFCFCFKIFWGGCLVVKASR